MTNLNEEHRASINYEHICAGEGVAVAEIISILSGSSIRKICAEIELLRQNSISIALKPLPLHFSPLIKLLLAISICVSCVRASMTNKRIRLLSSHARSRIECNLFFNTRRSVSCRFCVAPCFLVLNFALTFAHCFSALIQLLKDSSPSVRSKVAEAISLLYSY